MSRTYRKTPDGGLIADHGSLDAPGHGLRVFSESVTRLRASGFKRISTYAVGSKTDPAFNGYYTWARYGYDAPIPEGLRVTLPTALSSAQTTLDLMRTPEGRAWWRERGTAVYADFDLHPSSRSSRELERYMAERAGKRSDAERAVLEQEARARFERTGRAEETDLPDDEEAELEATAARMRELGWL
jgi:hypothetical protein